MTAEAKPQPLTRADRQVLLLMAKGYTDHRIGRQLGRTRSAVSSRITRIRGKLGARNRPQAVVLGIVAGHLVFTAKGLAVAPDA